MHRKTNMHNFTQMWDLNELSSQQQRAMEGWWEGGEQCCIMQFSIARGKDFFVECFHRKELINV